jgi:hypothetical protein
MIKTLPSAALSLVFGCLSLEEVFRCRGVCTTWHTVRAAWPVIDTRGFVLTKHRLGSEQLFETLYANCVPGEVREFVADFDCPRFPTAFPNLEQCRLYLVNMSNYTTPLAFGHRLDMLYLHGCLFAKNSTPLAGLETRRLIIKCSRWDMEDCDLSVNNGISELDFINIKDADARQVSAMHSVTSLGFHVAVAGFSAAGFKALLTLPLLRRLCLFCARLDADAFQVVPENLVETLALVYDEVTACDPQNVARFAAQFQALQRLELALHRNWKHLESVVRERVRALTRPELVLVFKQ